MASPLPSLRYLTRIVPLGVFTFSGGLVTAGCGRSGLDLWGDELTSGGGRSAGTGGGGPERGDGGAGGRGVGGAGPGGASAGAPQDCGARIDDMEDYDGHICAGQGRVGAWYVFHDATEGGVQWPAETPPGTGIEMSLIPGGRDASRVAVHTYGGDFTYWGSGVGLDLNYDGAKYRLYDASRYRGLHFWARSSKRDLLRVRVNTESKTDVKYGGTCDVSGAGDCPGPSGANIRLLPEWRDYTVTFEELGVVDEESRLTSIQFMTKGSFDFWVDDLTFVEGEPNCCSDLPQCRRGVTFVDPILQSTLVGSVSAGAKLGCDRACSVRDVTPSGAPVQALDGLECLAQLESVTLHDSSVASLQPLSGSTRLQTLSINGSSVSDLGPLSASPSLRSLYIGGARITDVRPLVALTKLEDLDLSGNALGDVRALSGLTSLQTLRLAGTQLRDASPLYRLSALTRLDLAQNELEDFRPGPTLPVLAWLNLAHNRLASLGTSLELPALEELNLDDNRMADATALSSLGALRILHFNDNELIDVSPLASLDRLQTLELSRNLISSSVGALSGMSRLKVVDLSHNRISNVGTVSGLPELVMLRLEDNQLEEVSGLAALTTLFGLNLSRNRIRTIESPFPLHVAELGLSDNGLEVIAEGALSGMSVSVLVLDNNPLRDLLALSDVTFEFQRCDRCDYRAFLGLSNVPGVDLEPLLRSNWPQGMTDVGRVQVTEEGQDCAARASTIQALKARKVAVLGCP
jgi:Leucine-rich repeat (LRR) protein